MSMYAYMTMKHHLVYMGCCGRDRIVVDLQLPVQSVVSLNPAHGEAHSIQHYVIKFEVGIVSHVHLHPYHFLLTFSI